MPSSPPSSLLLGCVIIQTLFNFSTAFAPPLSAGYVCRASRLGSKCGAPPLRISYLRRLSDVRATTTLRAAFEAGEGSVITEDEVERAVARAEDLWERALTARKKAEECSNLAEQAAMLSQSKAESVKQALDETKSFSLGMVAKSQMAVNSSWDAANLLGNAAEANALADALEAEAEEALRESEEALEKLISIGSLSLEEEE